MFSHSKTASGKKRKVYAGRHGLWEALDRSVVPRPLASEQQEGTMQAMVCHEVSFLQVA